MGGMGMGMMNPAMMSSMLGAGALGTAGAAGLGSDTTAGGMLPMGGAMGGMGSGGFEGKGCWAPRPSGWGCKAALLCAAPGPPCV